MLYFSCLHKFLAGVEFNWREVMNESNKYIYNLIIRKDFVFGLINLKFFQCVSLFESHCFGILLFEICKIFNGYFSWFRTEFKIDNFWKFFNLQIFIVWIQWVRIIHLIINFTTKTVNGEHLVLVVFGHYFTYHLNALLVFVQF